MTARITRALALIAISTLLVLMGGGNSVYAEDDLYREMTSE